MFCTPMGQISHRTRMLLLELTVAAAHLDKDPPGAGAIPKYPKHQALDVLQSDCELRLELH